MKKSGLTIDDVKNKINELKGKQIQMVVCRGRKKVTKYNGVLESALSRVFVVAIEGSDKPLTYSYSDIVCGEVQVAGSENGSANLA